MIALFAGVRACRQAECLCGRLYAGDPVRSSSVCADEPTRFVVRVFCGYRDPPRDLRPQITWARCIIVAVDKNTRIAEQIVDDKRYRPMLR